MRYCLMMLLLVVFILLGYLGFIEKIQYSYYFMALILLFYTIFRWKNKFKQSRYNSDPRYNCNVSSYYPKYNSNRYIIRKINIKIKWCEGNDKEFIEGEIFDLSKSGVFIVANIYPPVKTLINMEFNIKHELIKCSGVIVRVCNKSQGVYPKGIGIKFKKMKREQRVKIKKFLQTIEDKFNIM